MKKRKGERERREIERNQERTLRHERESECGGERSIGRIYICMLAEGTMYSNCEKKGCTFRGKVI